MEKEQEAVERLAPLLLTRKQAAHALGVTPRWLELAAWKKTGPTFVKLGKQCLYPMHDLKSFVDSLPRRCERCEQTFTTDGET